MWITGPIAERRRFINGLKHDPHRAPTENGTHIIFLILDSYIPMPSELLELDKNDLARNPNPMVKTLIKKYGASNWYDWQNRYWGCKWGDCETKIKVNSRQIFASFRVQSGAGELARSWGTPIVAFNQIARLFPKLKFKIKFYECGMCFKGTLIYTGGRLVGSTRSEYHGNRGGFKLW
jgi:hypothetical protein